MVASSSLLAQNPTSSAMARVALPPHRSGFQHRKTLHAVYDSTSDSTRLSVVTHAGKYFLTVQRPRLTWTASYAGRVPGAAPPEEIVLEFRTQSPQTALSSLLVIEYGENGRLQVRSAGAYSEPGVRTWSHFMRFRVPRAALAGALTSDRMVVTVGGVEAKFKPDQVEALRDLLSRVEAGR
ncbi:MAG: hypothetical protein H0V43_08985 [Gemmatimonadales bacterium]|nr:hypothetical protein [Gemmatimonadales bacterium]MBA3554592.1 hypothetical protein [Gemmatimonadales bacterium]